MMLIVVIISLMLISIQYSIFSYKVTQYLTYQKWLFRSKYQLIMYSVPLFFYVYWLLIPIPYCILEILELIVEFIGID